MGRYIPILGDKSFIIIKHGPVRILANQVRNLLWQEANLIDVYRRKSPNT